MSPRRETYRCTVERLDDGQVQTIVIEMVDLEGVPRSVRVSNASATRIAGALHDVLRAAGVSGRAWSAGRPIDLDPVPGGQVALLLQAVKPMRRADRIDQIAERIAEMSREEASYWHAKAHQPGGLRALRVLLTNGATR